MTRTRRDRNAMTDPNSGQVSQRAALETGAQATLSTADRALAEAEERRKAYLEHEATLPKELGGRGGKEPVRYGDWEIKGLASDF
jgi:hypothetical protein